MSAPQLPEDAFQQWLDNRQLHEALKDWITENQLINFAEVSRNTARNWRCQKRVSHSKLVSIRMYYVPDMVDELMKRIWQDGSSEKLLIFLREKA